MASLYDVISILVLAGLLFVPVSKLIWVLSVRRLQRKLQTELSAEEINGQLTRARFVSLFLSTLFAALFYANMFGLSTHG